VAETGGRPGNGVSALRVLEDADVVAVVGPLLASVLSEVSEADLRAVPVISPTAVPREETEGVLSLMGPDVLGSRQVARLAWDMGLERVMVVRPQSPAAAVEAEEFIRTFEEVGGAVLREVLYPQGQTFFQAELGEAEVLLPDGVFFPLPPADVRVLAPQFTYYGLDTLGIQPLGTTGWTAREVVEEVDSRHTDGVIATTPNPAAAETEAFARFRRGYETLHQRTLRSEIPALGYDATALLLEALRSGRFTAAGIGVALEGVQDFPGATGRLSVIDGRILREPHLVRIQDHELIYISPRFE
jgi:ABC-type branched-subunit amino acid transport system substrate-binding protein